MTENRHGFMKNLRIIIITMVSIVILFFAFEIFIDHQITFATVGPAIAQLIVLTYLIINNPKPPLTPSNEQTAREITETKQT